MKLDDDDSIVNSFRELGKSALPTEMIFKRFVCQVYSWSGPIAIAALIHQLFRSKNLEGEMLPTTRAALLPHSTRSNYITMRNKSCVTNFSKLPAIEEGD